MSGPQIFFLLVGVVIAHDFLGGMFWILLIIGLVLRGCA